MGQDMWHHKIALSTHTHTLTNTHTHTLTNNAIFSIIQKEHIPDCLFMSNR